MAITRDHIHIESIGPETTEGHDDGGRYATVTFRVLDGDHPNSFTVPVPVNLDQFGQEGVERHARYVFHHLLRTLAETTRDWDALDQPSGAGLRPGVETRP
jgi:hypothetical protein